MKIGLFFGSFNPIHHGHLLVATYIREEAQLDEVWFIVSPLNPFKEQADLEDELHRLEMVRIAIQHNNYLKVSDIEFNLSKPSYTYITLKELTVKFPNYTFNIIIGEDNVSTFKDWKEASWILSNFSILVYNRTMSDSIYNKGEFTLYNLPAFDISSTEIRKRIKNNLSIRYFVPESVEHFIRFHNLYTE